MNNADKILRLQTLLDDAEATEPILTAYLAEARDVILNRMYPFGIPEWEIDVPRQYDTLQCKLAERYFLRRGAEGEISHNENGVSRTYGTVNDEDLLCMVVQRAKVVGNAHA